MKSHGKSFTEIRRTEKKSPEPLFRSDSRMEWGNGPQKLLPRIKKIHQNPTSTLSTHISPILGFYVKRKEKRTFVSLVIDEIKLKGNAVFSLGEATL